MQYLCATSEDIATGKQKGEEIDQIIKNKIMDIDGLNSEQRTKLEDILNKIFRDSPVELNAMSMSL